MASSAGDPDSGIRHRFTAAFDGHQGSAWILVAWSVVGALWGRVAWRTLDLVSRPDPWFEVLLEHDEVVRLFLPCAVGFFAAAAWRRAGAERPVAAVVPACVAAAAPALVLSVVLAALKSAPDAEATFSPGYPTNTWAVLAWVAGTRAAAGAAFVLAIQFLATLTGRIWVAIAAVSAANIASVFVVPYSLTPWANMLGSDSPSPARVIAYWVSAIGAAVLATRLVANRRPVSATQPT